MKKQKTYPKQSLIQNLGLGILSLVLFFVLLSAGLKLYSKYLGISEFSFCYENEVGIWQKDEDAIFINKPDLRTFCFGDVDIYTNNDGFRSLQEITKKKNDKAIRIFGLGDSVMWGVGVNKEYTFLDLLSARFKENGFEAEAINGGVVGYSTYQELLFMKKKIILFDPDIILVNFCTNDFFPSEDPFGNFRVIYSAYLNSILKSDGYSLSMEEKILVKHCITALDRKYDLRPYIIQPADSPFLQVMRKVLIEIPMLEMAKVAKEHGIRLIFLFIPPRNQGGGYTYLVSRISDVLSKNNIEYIDLIALMDPGREEKALKEYKEIAFLKMNFSILRKTPLADLEKILFMKKLKKMHARYKYIDNFHPTKKGNRMIAWAIYDYISKNDINIINK